MLGMGGEGGCARMRAVGIEYCHKDIHPREGIEQERPGMVRLCKQHNDDGAGLQASTSRMGSSSSGDSCSNSSRRENESGRYTVRVMSMSSPNSATGDPLLTCTCNHETGLWKGHSSRIQRVGWQMPATLGEGVNAKLQDRMKRGIWVQGEHGKGMKNYT